MALLLAGGAARAADAPLSDASGYELGRGLRLGDTGATLGGYVTGEYQRLAQSRDQLRSSHASVFVWWEGLERFKVFGELDLENLIARHRGDDGDDDADRRVSLERLYADYSVNDALTLRLGKFLTPIGRWNLVHADPLVWTTSRPLLTQSVFPHNLTGLMASGTLSSSAFSLQYSLYASNGAEWAVDDRQDPFTTVRGGRVVLPIGNAWQIGASYANYQQRGSRGEPRTLAGVDVLWANQGYEISAEWLQTSADSPGPPIQPEPHGDAGPGIPRAVPSRGAYLQGVMPLAGRLYAVGRLEWMRDSASPGTRRLSTVGLAWRPYPATSLKIEYQRPQRGTFGPPSEGWLASASVLF